jgi:hypothetical protein
MKYVYTICAIINILNGGMLIGLGHPILGLIFACIGIFYIILHCENEAIK